MHPLWGTGTLNHKGRFHAPEASRGAISVDSVAAAGKTIGWPVLSPQARMLSDAAAPGSLSVSTSLSLLERAKARDGAAWDRLVNLYSPLVYRWARKAGLQAHDAQDVVQTVFLTVASDIDSFRRTRAGDSFRGWLCTICRHKILDRFRERRRQAEATGGSTAQHDIQQIAAPEFDTEPGSDERCRLRHRALALLRDQFEPHTWQAFHRSVVHGDRPADVARDLGISVATVYRAKFRVLARLRKELEGL